MNDFTKEELEILLSFLNQGMIESMSHRFHYDELSKKMKYMIDTSSSNNCKHESDGYDYFKIGEDELLLEVLKKRKYQLKCIRCGVIYND